MQEDVICNFFKESQYLFVEVVMGFTLLEGSNIRSYILRSSMNVFLQILLCSCYILGGYCTLL